MNLTRDACALFFSSRLQSRGECPVTLHMTLGNHDDRAAFRKALESQRDVIRPLADRNVASAGGSCAPPLAARGETGYFHAATESI